MQLLKGKEAAEAIKQQLTSQIQVLKERKLRLPHLVAVLIGNNGASETYVASKIKNCGEIGFESSLIRYDENIAESELLNKIFP